MRYGLFELNQSKPLTGDNMAETAKKCPPQVQDLIVHLRSTGTGEGKLKTLENLGKNTDSLNEFIAFLPQNIPLETMKKVDAYLLKVSTDKAGTTSKVRESWTQTDRAKALLKAHKESTAQALEDSTVDDSKAVVDTDEASEVSSMNADEAIDAISRMRSVEKLQNISSTDKRKTVKEAADNRIKELSEGQ